MSRAVLALLVIGTLLFGCTGAHTPAAYMHPLQRSDRCVRADYVAASDAAEVSLSPEDEALIATAPPDVARLLRAARLPLATASRTSLLMHLLVLKSEISSAQAYTDCLGDSIEDHLRQEVLERRDRTELHLTLASIGIGAAAGIAAGIVELHSPDAPAAPILAIAGGVSSAALGAMAIMLPAPKIRLAHRTNVLRAVWHGDEPGGLPEFVWRLLRSPRPDAPAPREALQSQWDGMLAQHSPSDRTRLEALLFGDGGSYDLPALVLRETMLDQLETEVDLMNPEFQRLTEFVERVVHEREARGAERASEH